MPVYAGISGNLSTLGLLLGSGDECKQSVPDPDLTVAMTRHQYTYGETITEDSVEDHQSQDSCTPA
jgi:hypothetical protein